MRKIYINFSGFWPEFDPINNFITETLSERFNVEISDNPDYLFCSVFDHHALDHDGIRIFYTGENICPDFNVFDYAIGFEYLNFGDRYLRLPNYFLSEYKTDIELMMRKHILLEKDYPNGFCEREGFCSFVVSKGNGYVDAAREDFFNSLSQYKKVSSGGRYLNNIGIPEGVADKLEFQREHKFAIAFENSSHSGYTTEKIVQAFAAGTIPIYWGDPDISKVFNEKSFINCHNYRSFQDVVETVMKLDNDDELYMQYLREPALNDSNHISIMKEEMKKFLWHIVDMDISDAYRRDRVGYGKMHCDEMVKTQKMRSSKWLRLVDKNWR